MSEKYPLWRRQSEEIFLQLIRDQRGPYELLEIMLGWLFIVEPVAEIY
jgi:hypothetical protein